MITLRERNVNGLFSFGVSLLRKVGERQSSRVGDVLVAPFPVMSVYERPMERVLFDATRDANPFFHLMEALWMLAGRDDADFLNQFVKDFGTRYAEPDGTLHGAYGKRWRKWFSKYPPMSDMDYIDQLRYAIGALKRDSTDRRVVIQMWDADADIGAKKRDVPCNTQIYPRIVSGALDITVMCRSNDIIWGAYGANAVHFSVLQEYLAAGIGCRVGKMYQLSNNFHAYVDIFDKQKSPSTSDRYQTGYVSPLPLVDNFELFDEEVKFFCDGGDLITSASNSFLSRVAGPMRYSYSLWREKERDAAVEIINRMPTCDWKIACLEWYGRRLK